MLTLNSVRYEFVNKALELNREHLVLYMFFDNQKIIAAPTQSKKLYKTYFYYIHNHLSCNIHNKTRVNTF